MQFFFPLFFPYIDSYLMPLHKVDFYNVFLLVLHTGVLQFPRAVIVWTVTQDALNAGLNDSLYLGPTIRTSAAILSSSTGTCNIVLHWILVCACIQVLRENKCKYKSFLILKPHLLIFVITHTENLNNVNPI